MKTKFRRLLVPALDLQATRRFYRDLLALPDYPGEPGELCFLSSGIEICFASETQAPPDAATLGAWMLEFEVNEFEQLVEKLRQAGASFLVDPISEGDAGRHAVVLDPNGHQVRLREPAT